MRGIAKILIFLFVLVIIFPLTVGIIVGLVTENKENPEIVYLEAFDKQSVEIADSIGRISPLMDDFMKRKVESTDSEWQAAVEKEFEIWQKVYEEAQALEPTPEYWELHEDWLGVLDGLSSAFANFGACGMYSFADYNLKMCQQWWFQFGVLDALVRDIEVLLEEYQE